jgi:hypothetical protein
MTNSFKDESGYPAEVVPSTHRDLVLNGGALPHGLVQGLYLHAPGLTLVTLGTACIPSVRLPPTTWGITGPSKGLRIK